MSGKPDLGVFCQWQKLHPPVSKIEPSYGYNYLLIIAFSQQWPYHPILNDKLFGLHLSRLLSL